MKINDNINEKALAKTEKAVDEAKVVAKAAAKSVV